MAATTSPTTAARYELNHRQFQTAKQDNEGFDVYHYVFKYKDHFFIYIIIK